MHLFWNMISWLLFHAMSKHWHDSAALRKKTEIALCCCKCKPTSEPYKWVQLIVLQEFLSFWLKHYSRSKEQPEPKTNAVRDTRGWEFLSLWDTESFYQCYWCPKTQIPRVHMPLWMSRKVADEFTDLFFPSTNLTKPF